MYKTVFILLSVSFHLFGAAELQPWKNRLNTLSNLEKHVIVDKGTERPWSGKYVKSTAESV